MERMQPLTRRGLLQAASAVPLAAAMGSAADRARAQSTGSRRPDLVAYFSRTGNTALVARKIAFRRQAEIFEIRPAEAYPEDYEETVAQAERERQAGYEPPLAARVPDVAGYDIVFLGFPVWGMTAPPVIRSFLSRHGFAGKTIVPFITHGGYGVGSSLDVIARHASDAQIVEGFSMEGEQERRVVEHITAWLSDLRLTK
jgi:flavodoxin